MYIVLYDWELSFTVILFIRYGIIFIELVLNLLILIRS